MSPRVNDRVRFAHAHGPWMPGDAGVVASGIDVDGEVLVAFNPEHFDEDCWQGTLSLAWWAEPHDPDLSPDYIGGTEWVAWVPAAALEVVEPARVAFPIRTGDDLARAHDLIVALADAEPGTPDGDLREVMEALSDHYQREHAGLEDAALHVARLVLRGHYDTAGPYDRAGVYEALGRAASRVPQVEACAEVADIYERARRHLRALAERESSDG